ncbi:hypothetical protein ABVS_3404 (plasmid) [Acinetobacter lwoffii]|nr:hypothetical protein ABVS_3404 [Acinetobacter lwoffii]
MNIDINPMVEKCHDFFSPFQPEKISRRMILISYLISEE